MEILKVTDLQKSFGEKQVLKNISFSVGKGEVVSVIGSSGSGKSTLLRCLTMLENVSGGEICYKGKRLAWTDDSVVRYASKEDVAKIKSYFGLVFQNFNLFPHMTVLRNITEAPIKVGGRDADEVRAEAMALLSRLGLAGKAGEYPCHLSGGEQQRVSIARALICKPEILFFDEPTSALDPELTAGILGVIKELAAEKMTMVIVTHEMSFARDVSDKIIFMDKGVIAASGAPDEIFVSNENERLKAFLSSFHS